MSGRVQRASIGLAMLAAVVAAWSVVSASGAVKSVVLPSIPDTWSALQSVLDDPGEVGSAIQATLWPLLVSFAIAAPLGVAVGVAVGRSPLLRAAYEPLLANLNTLPFIVLYPLLAGLIGLGALPQVVVGTLAAFFPIAIAAIWAARDVDSTLLTAARSMGASGWTLVRAVSLPAAMPGILAGLRTGLGLAFVTIVAAQFVSSTEGLGYELAEMSQAFRTPELFAWVLITLLCSAVIGGAWSLLKGQIERGVRR
jgi:ABC-type nitrate/sulfonate/bicarbonate transport system permease component